MRALLLVTVGAAVLTGCPAEVPPPEIPPAPEVLEFRASADQADPGSTVTLSWNTRGATQLELRDAANGIVSGVNDAAASGSVEVTIEADALFVLTAKNDRGVRASAAVFIEVRDGVRPALFTASPGRIVAGESTTLAWAAFGAREVWLRDESGKAVLLGDQLETGSVVVSPLVDTRYLLNVDGSDSEIAVGVTPSVPEFTASHPFVEPGAAITLLWKTLGATSVTLSQAGASTLFSTNDPGRVANGGFVFEVPETVDPSAVFSFELRAQNETSGSSTVAVHSLFVGGGVGVSEWKVPSLAPVDRSFTLSWKTIGADVVEIYEDGQILYRSPVNPTVAASGSYNVATPAGPRKYKLRAIKLRGGEAWSDELEMVPIGPPAVTTFTAAPQPGVTHGGDPVTLTWDVPNARNLKIVATGQYEVTRVTDLPAEAGSVIVYPNVDTEYVLTADNTVGDAITSTVNVTVATPAGFQFLPATAPLGAMVTVTSHDVPNGAEVSGFLSVVKNAPGEQFEDISATGVATNFTGADLSSQMKLLPAVFSTRLFGQVVSGNRISVSPNGWFKFDLNAVQGPDTPTPFPTNALAPLAIAPYWEDLRDLNGEIYVQIDTVGTEKRLIVQWDKFQYDVANVAVPGSELTFQAQIYESGKVVFAYQTLTNITGATPSIGVVNASESIAVKPLDRPVAGDTYTFFTPVTLPATVAVDGNPMTTRVAIPTDHFIEITSAYPLLAAGQLAITEVNANPPASVVDGQWFEVENKSANPFDFNGWSVEIGGATHTFTGPTVLAPNGRMVFGQSATAGDGVAVGAVYGNGLAMTPGGALKLTVGGTSYVSSTLPEVLPGRSWQVGPLAPGLTAVSGTTELGCVASSTNSYGTHGQYGTPGALNASCPAYLAGQSIPGAFESIAATGTQLAMVYADNYRLPFALASPVNVYGVPVSTLWVNTNGFIVAGPQYNCAGANNCYQTNKLALSPGTVPSGVIAPYWDDLVSPAVFVAQKDPDGVAGSGDEVAIVSWEGSSRKSTATDVLNFQVKFFANGTIEYHYGTMTGVNGLGATTWLEDPTGRAAWIVNLDSNTNPGIPANSAIRFSLH